MKKTTASEADTKSTLRSNKAITTKSSDQAMDDDHTHNEKGNVEEKEAEEHGKNKRLESVADTSSHRKRKVNHAEDDGSCNKRRKADEVRKVNKHKPKTKDRKDTKKTNSDCHTRRSVREKIRKIKDTKGHDRQGRKQEMEDLKQHDKQANKQEMEDSKQDRQAKKRRREHSKDNERQTKKRKTVDSKDHKKQVRKQKTVESKQQKRQARKRKTKEDQEGHTKKRRREHSKDNERQAKKQKTKDSKDQKRQARKKRRKNTKDHQKQSRKRRTKDTKGQERQVKQKTNDSRQQEEQAKEKKNEDVKQQKEQIKEEKIEDVKLQEEQVKEKETEDVKQQKEQAKEKKTEDVKQQERHTEAHKNTKTPECKVKELMSESEGDMLWLQVQAERVSGEKRDLREYCCIDVQQGNKVKGSVHGHPCTVCLDTGSEVTVMMMSLAETMGLITGDEPRVSKRFHTYMGKLNLDVIALDEVVISLQGGVQINTPVEVFPKELEDRYKVDQITVSMYRLHQAEIVQEYHPDGSGSLYLRHPERLRQRPPSTSKATRVYTFTLQPLDTTEPVSVLVDTGSPCILCVSKTGREYVTSLTGRCMEPPPQAFLHFGQGTGVMVDVVPKPYHKLYDFKCGRGLLYALSAVTDYID